MLIVVALGGNALLKRGEQMRSDVQEKNVRIAVSYISEIIKSGHNVVICHGNGPQVGLLALQSELYESTNGLESYPIDVLVAESQGMIGYMIQRELLNTGINASTLLTHVLVDRDDIAFSNPTKPIGPIYEQEPKNKNWNVSMDGKHYRRVIASPTPKEIIEINDIISLMKNGSTVICCGGGGIPIYRDKEEKYIGIECVVDKDRTSSLLARKIHADSLLILTDADGIYTDWNTSNEKKIDDISCKELRKMEFASGSMLPKVIASCDFVENTGNIAYIGSLSKISEILDGKSGTRIHK